MFVFPSSSRGAASRPSVTGQGGAGAGVQLPGRHSKREPAEGHGAGVHQLLFRPQKPHSVSGSRRGLFVEQDACVGSG